MKQIRQEKQDKERGSATVEAIISFTGFLFVIFTILNVVNFCRAQALISNAVDTATKELTQYSYFYKMSGLQKFSGAISNNAEQGKTNLNDVLGTVDNLYQSIGTAYDNTSQNATNIKNAVEAGDADLAEVQHTLSELKTDGTNIETSMSTVLSAMEAVKDNPILYMKSIIAVAGNEALDLLKSHVIAAPLAKMFVSKHFGKDSTEANKTLEDLGVVDGLEGMNFKMSTIFSSKKPDDVHIVVYYRLKLVQIFGWATLEVPMCKESVARAWLGGDHPVEKVEPMVPSTPESSDPGSNETEEEPETKETEEPAETNEPEPVDITNSYWHMDPWYVEEESFDNLLVSSKGIDREETVFNGLVYGRDQYNTVYGMAYCVDAKHVYSNLIYYDSIKQIKAKEQQYIDSGGANGYEPGSTLVYKYVIYVPENISDEEYAKIKAASEENRYDFSAMAYEDFGLEVSVGVEIIKAGGNYDYGSAG